MDTEHARPGDAGWLAAQRTFVRGWRLLVLITVPLVYLVFVGGAVATYAR